MISLHIIVDNASQERLDRALLYLTRTKQTAVCIGGGAQLDRTVQYIERVRGAMPNITIMMRIIEDTGILLKLTSQQWYERYITPRMKWLQDNKIVIVVDNETSGDDGIIKEYVSRSIIAKNMLHSVGLYGAFCRFATGNIVESQYALLKPLLDQLSPYDWVSPNEYSNVPPLSSGGHLERYKRIQAATSRTLKIAIGECGVLNDYQANAGYHSVGMNGVDMAKQLLTEEMWYNNGTIPRFLFCIGGYGEWDSLQVGDDALEYLESYYAAHPIGQVPPPPPPPPDPPPVPVPSDKILVSRVVLQALRDTVQKMLNVIDALLKDHS